MKIRGQLHKYNVGVHFEGFAVDVDGRLSHDEETKYTVASSSL